MSYQGPEYLKPGTKTPEMLRKKQNGQFSNPPLFMQMGGAKSKAMLNKTEDSKELSLEKSKPSARKGRPF